MSTRRDSLLAIVVSSFPFSAALIGLSSIRRGAIRDLDSGQSVQNCLGAASIR
jgi:hypothetical protein